MNSLVESSVKPPYVIFLDIDGVLLSDWEKHHAQDKPLEEAVNNANILKGYLRQKDRNSFSNNYWSVIVAHHFNHQALQNLNDLIQRVKAVATPQIVIHSRWRRHVSVEVLKNIHLGMHAFSQYIIDKTPDEIEGPKGHLALKGDEIRYWLEHHPEVKQYIILDDEDERCQKYFKERFIWVSSRNLLTSQDVRKALEADPFTASCANITFTKPAYTAVSETFLEYNRKIKADFYIEEKVIEEPEDTDEEIEILPSKVGVRSAIL